MLARVEVGQVDDGEGRVVVHGPGRVEQQAVDSGPVQDGEEREHEAQARVGYYPEGVLDLEVPAEDEAGGDAAGGGS